MGSPGTKSRWFPFRTPARGLGTQSGGAGGFPVTGWRDRLVALRVPYADADSVNCADSLSNQAVGTNGATGIGIKAAESPILTPARVSQGNRVISVLPVLEGSTGRRDIAHAPVPRADQPSHLVGYLNAAQQRPPSWTDSTALPSRGCFCSCCKGQRWWSERDAPKGWRCCTCHPPNHLPSEQTEIVQTGQGANPVFPHATNSQEPRT